MDELIEILKHTNQFGLVLNFFGAVSMAFSIGRPPEDAYQEDNKGRKIHLAAIVHPVAFVVGIILLIIGFAFQLIHTFI